jgi:hypothetical protein
MISGPIRDPKCCSKMTHPPPPPPPPSPFHVREDQSNKQRKNVLQNVITKSIYSIYIINIIVLINEDELNPWSKEM